MAREGALSQAADTIQKRKVYCLKLRYAKHWEGCTVLGCGIICNTITL